MFPTTDISKWGDSGSEGPWGSFYRRYQRPLVHYAQRRLGVDAELAGELVARFVARELAREERGERPIFRLYDPIMGRFRSLLATSFWRFARDELAKEGRRRGISLDEHPGLGEREADDEFCKLVAREFFQAVRAGIHRRAGCDEERQVLELKWPLDPACESLPNAEVERRLGLTRARVRTLNRRIGESFIAELRHHASQAGLSSAEIGPFLADTCAALDRP